jgi:hypothetical protein
VANGDDIPGGPPPSPPPPPPPLPSLPDYGAVGPYFDPAGQPYVPLPGQDPGEFSAPQIFPGAPAPGSEPSVLPPSIPGGPGLTPGGTEALFPGAPFGGGPVGYYPGRGKLSQRELRRLVGEQAPGIGLAAIMGGIDKIFASVRRRPSARTIITRAVREGFRLGRDVAERVIKGPVPPLPEVLDPTLKRLTGPVAKVPIYLRYGLLGEAFGWYMLLKPHTLGPGDLTPDQVKYYGLNPLPEKAIDPRFPARYIGTGPSPFPLGQPVNVGLDRVLGRLPKQTPDLPRELTPREQLRQVLQDIATGQTPDILRMQREGGTGRMIDQGTEVGPQIPPAATGPVQGVPQVQVGGPQARRGGAARPRIGLGIGAIATGLVLESIRRGGSRRGPEPGATFTPVETSQPGIVPTPAPTPLTTFNTVSLQSGFVGGGGAECNCAPRGPRRKCLQRGPVKWSGGPRKGKAAGSKCIRFAARRTR